MKRGCTQCGECLDVCPVYALFKREEYSPKGKRLLMEPLDAEFGGLEEGFSWERIRELARLCAGCGRCQLSCARKLSTSDLLAEARARNPHWSQKLWEVWIRRAGPLWPLAGRIAMLVPDAVVPGRLQSSLETARALVDLPPCEPWMHIRPEKQVPGTRVALFSGCTARNARTRWTDKAETLLRAWGYDVLDATDFTCCGATLHHAGQYAAHEDARARNIDVWRSLGKPLIASFCASCKHGLDEYAAVLPQGDAEEWKKNNVGLAALLVNPAVRKTPNAPAAIGYHQPCHWQNADPDMPLLKKGLPGLKKGTGLCCGMGGILKMSNPDLSADMARDCIAGFPPETSRIVTGCSGCVMQLASAAPEGVEVRHWLDVVTTEERT